MSSLITVTYTDTQPSRRRSEARVPRVVKVDVSSAAVQTAARAGVPAYSREGRIQLVTNFLALMGLVPMTGDLAPIIDSKRTIANRGFTATVWVTD